MSGLFITGTDTGVGKTRVAVALIHALRAQGLRVAAMKPVAAGSNPGELNDDVSALLQASNVAADLRDINPYSFAPPIAPHLAAQQAGVRIELPVIVAAYARLAAAADVVVVEGAGGWRVPLGWVGNTIDPAMACQAANLDALRARLPMPCLGVQDFSIASIRDASELGWLTLPITLVS